MIQRLIACGLLAALTIQCASTAHGRGQKIHVTSSPSGAAVRLTCGTTARDAGTTPVDVVVPRSAENCSIGLNMAGHNERTVPLTRMRSNLIWLNLVPGFIVGAAMGSAATVGSLMDTTDDSNDAGNGAFVAGLAVGTGAGMLIDHTTGAWYRQVPERIDATLDPK
jgi:hypothetical protein